MEFADVQEEKTLIFDGPKKCTWVKMTVNSVFKGTKWNDLAVSEMHPLAKDE